MKHAYGLLPATLLALALAGCGGSAAPATPIGAQGIAPQSFTFARPQADDADPANSYSHVLLKTVPPVTLSQPLKDGQTITLDVSATNAGGQPISLTGATIVWAKPAHGTVVPAKNGQSGTYTAPAKGSGGDTISVTVTLPGQTQKITGSAAIQYSPQG